MHDKTARVFMGLGVLVVVWIAVYWLYPVRDDGSSLGELSTGELEAELADQNTADAETGERFAAPSGGGEQSTPIRPLPRPVVVNPPEPEEGEGATPDRVSDRGVIPPEFREYTVVSGDTFERISQKVYGTRRHGMAIGRANPLLDPRKLREGMTIRVPVDPSNIQGLPVDEDGTPREPGPPESSPTIEYTVKRGDTLSSIAKAFYGSVRHVDYLYDANRGRLASKDDLRLGQVLLIPPLPEGAE